MDQKDVFRQMVSFNKQTFENTFNALVVLQDQSEALFNSMLERATWLPEDGKKAVGDWAKTTEKPGGVSEIRERRVQEAGGFPGQAASPPRRRSPGVRTPPRSGGVHDAARPT